MSVPLISRVLYKFPIVTDFSVPRMKYPRRIAIHRASSLICRYKVGVKGNSEWIEFDNKSGIVERRRGGRSKSSRLEWRMNRERTGREWIFLFTGTFVEGVR